MKEELTQRTWPQGAGLGFDESAQNLHGFDSLTSLTPCSDPIFITDGKVPGEAGGNWKICDLEMFGARVGAGTGGGGLCV